MKENREKIRAFMARYISTHDLLDDDDIFASGFVNSLFAMQLVLFVETEFALRIENEDLKMDHFKSISALDHLIERKLLQVQNSDSA